MSLEHKNNTNEIGSHYWQTTNGSLNNSEKRKYFTMLLQAQLKERYMKVQKALGLTKFPSIDFSEVKLPDSALAKRAVAEAESIYTTALLKHCYRTYFWAVGTATAEKMKYDSEMLFVASILHDIGLSNSHKHICTTQCFAVYGADKAQQVLADFNLPEEKNRKLYEAIGMHLNPTISKKSNFEESYLLSRGAVMDVIGAFHFLMTPEFIKDVQKSYDRKDFKEEITNTMTNYDHLKNTRADLLYRWGFANMAKKNPLDKITYTCNSK